MDGAAVGLGATMLVHFDLVFASDKATFETPYTQLGHIAEGAATTILGRLLVAEMIMGSQRLTAGQAHYYGLVTRTLWPDRFHDELIPLVKALARQSLQVTFIFKFHNFFSYKLMYLKNICNKYRYNKFGLFNSL